MRFVLVDDNACNAQITLLLIQVHILVSIYYRYTIHIYIWSVNAYMVQASLTSFFFFHFHFENFVVDVRGLFNSIFRCIAVFRAFSSQLVAVVAKFNFC